MVTARKLLSSDLIPPPLDSLITDGDYLAGVLDACYSTPFRHYHTLEHIHTMLKRAQMVQQMVDCKLSNEIYVAILFHDAVYDLRAAPEQNEIASSFLAQRLMPECMDGAVSYAKVAGLIMATAHQTDLCGMSHELQLIADIDMGGFGSDSATFLRDNENVAKEYETVFDSDSVRQGRLDFLRRLKEKKRIFYTRFFSDDMAHINIDLAIHNLEN
jgi:predicted metal-dependent HD superfamily phosphohydrolase